LVVVVLIHTYNSSDMCFAMPKVGQPFAI